LDPLCRFAPIQALDRPEAFRLTPMGRRRGKDFDFLSAEFSYDSGLPKKAGPCVPEKRKDYLCH
jgi:hypothetical protein